MTLKDDLTNDLARVFYDEEHFAQEIQFDGRDTLAIVDEERHLTQRGGSVYQLVRVQLPVGDLDVVPGKTVNYDGEFWFVDHVLYSDGVDATIDIRSKEAFAHEADRIQ